MKVPEPGLRSSGTIVRGSSERSVRVGDVDRDRDREGRVERAGQGQRQRQRQRENRRSRLNLARSVVGHLRSLRDRATAFFAGSRLHRRTRSRVEEDDGQNMDDVEDREASNADDGDVGAGHTRPFEAFPTLNRRPWFDSVKVAMMFCVLTSGLVMANIVYNIVLAARGSGQ